VNPKIIDHRPINRGQIQKWNDQEKADYEQSSFHTRAVQHPVSSRGVDGRNFRIGPAKEPQREQGDQ
jgi:hypothetical protein